MVKKIIDQAIVDAEIELQKLIHAKTIDPDIILIVSGNESYLSSNKANQIHDQYEFESDPTGLYVIPFLESTFDFKSTKQTVKIFCKPRRHKLIYRQWRRNIALGVVEVYLAFTKINLKIKNANLRESFFKVSKKEILKYIAANPSVKMDKTNLDPQMEKMLSFT